MDSLEVRLLMRMFRPLLAALLLAAMAGGCSGNPTPCTTDDDCFAGEVCAERVCTLATDDGQDAQSPAPDFGFAEDGSTSTSGDARPGPDPDASHPDTSGSDVSGSDSGTEACIVDPFNHTCSDDAYEENDDWIYGKRLIDQTVGCNPDFGAVEQAISATKCARDGSDWFFVEFKPCAMQDYVIEFELDVAENCAADLVKFEPLSFGCEEDFVQCREVDGKLVIQMLVESSSANSNTMYVEVHSDERNDVMFNYDLRVRVHE